MVKKKRRQANNKKNETRGFDFGAQQNVLAVADPEFNQALIEANVFACAYGFDRVTGYPDPMPMITLVAEHADPLRRAFDIFARWGCEEDGDVVDVRIILKNDGSYIMAISPEIERAIYCITPHSQLVRPVAFAVSWVKPFDTTNPYLSQLANYGRSWLAPVSVTGGIAAPNRHPPDITSLKALANLPRLIKFHLKIKTENEDPNNFFLHVGKKKGKQTKRSSYGSAAPEPKEYPRLRRKVIDMAFPVSRERVRKTELIRAVRNLNGFDSVNIDQIEQASINLVLSAELGCEQPHFVGLKDNFRDTVWGHIFDRIEHANDENRIEGLEAELVAAQLKLDVRTVLSDQGSPVAGKKFRQLQALFKRKGYVSD